MKYFKAGIVCAVIAIAIGLIFQSEYIYCLITGIIGFGGLGIYLFFNGFTTNKTYRITNTETAKEKEQRYKIADNIIRFSAPSVIVLVVYLIAVYLIKFR